MKEAHTLGHLRHPNVVAVWGVVLPPNLLLAEGGGKDASAGIPDQDQMQGHARGSLQVRPPALVCEYLAAGSLRAAISHDAPWLKQPLAKVKVLLDTARGLDYLHARQVVHFDLKSANLLVGFSNGAPIAKVADFGLSRYGPIAQTLNVGTSLYQAPDVIEAPPPAVAEVAGYDGRKADIWSAGVLLYAMLAGHYPFPDNVPQPVRLQAMRARPLQGLPQGLSQECKQLLEALLHPNPAERITIEGIRQDLWFAQGLPDRAFDMTAQYLNRPSPCVRTPQDIEDTITRVVQRLVPA